MNCPWKNLFLRKQNKFNTEKPQETIMGSLFSMTPATQPWSWPHTGEHATDPKYSHKESQISLYRFLCGCKFSTCCFNNTWTMNFQMFKLVLEKSEEPEVKLPTSAGSLKKQVSSRKTSISAFLTMPKPLTVWITTNWKILKEMGIPEHLTCLLRNLYASQEATVRTGDGTTYWF